MKMNKLIRIETKKQWNDLLDLVLDKNGMLDK